MKKPKEALTPLRCEILIAFIDSGMNAAAAGKSLYLTREAINYHLRKVKEKTGLDPKNFHDLVKLYELVKVTESKEGCQ